MAPIASKPSNPRKSLKMRFLGLPLEIFSVWIEQGRYRQDHWGGERDNTRSPSIVVRSSAEPSGGSLLKGQEVLRGEDFYLVPPRLARAALRDPSNQIGGNLPMAIVDIRRAEAAPSGSMPSVQQHE